MKKEKGLRFLLVVVMETTEYTCVPCFPSMRAILSKFEELRSNFEQNCLRLVFVGGCHGNDCIHMRTKFHLHKCFTDQV